MYVITSNAGRVVFEVAPFNVHEVERTTRTDFAETGVLGAPPPLKYVGEGPEELTLRGRLFPQQLGGLGELATLHHAATAGHGQVRHRGDPRSLEAPGGDGVGRVIDFEILLKRSLKPSNDEHHRAQPIGSAVANGQQPLAAIANV